MPDITNKRLTMRKRRRFFSPTATEENCLFCSHRELEHTGRAIGVRRQGGKN